MPMNGNLLISLSCQGESTKPPFTDLDSFAQQLSSLEELRTLLKERFGLILLKAEAEVNWFATARSAESDQGRLSFREIVEPD